MSSRKFPFRDIKPTISSTIVEPSLSITMPHYNRPQLLRNALYAYKWSHSDLIDKVEFVIVDDVSDEDKHADLVINELVNNFNVRYYKREEKDKGEVGPEVAVNICWELAKADLVVYQSCEVLPLTRCLDAFLNNDTYKKMYGFIPCYSICKEYQDSILQSDPSASDFYGKVTQVVKLKQRSVTFDGDDGWYSHPIYRPNIPWFYGAMSKEDFIRVGGANEDYKYGWWYSDNEFVDRVKSNGIQLAWVDTNRVVGHQYHYYSSMSSGKRNSGEGVTEKEREKFLKLTAHNKALLERDRSTL